MPQEPTRHILTIYIFFLSQLRIIIIMISSQKFISAFIRVNWMHWTALHWHSSYVLLGILAFNTHPDMRSEYDIYIYFWFGFRRPVPHGLALFRLSSPYIRILFFYFEYILWLTLSLFRHFEFGHSVHSSLFRAGSFFAFCVEKILFLVPHTLFQAFFLFPDTRTRWLSFVYVFAVLQFCFISSFSCVSFRR